MLSSLYIHMIYYTIIKETTNMHGHMEKFHRYEEERRCQTQNIEVHIYITTRTGRTVVNLRGCNQEVHDGLW